MPNAETLQHTKSCNQELVIEVMADYGQSIQQLVFTYVKDYGLAEDLTQEIFLKFYKKLHTFNNQSSLKTWLYQISINHCKDYLRSWHHRNFILDNEKINQTQTYEKDIEQQVIEKTEEHMLVQIVIQLPVIYREAVYFYYYEELTTKEIGQLTQENENTIKTRLNRARQMIKSKFKEGLL